MKLRSGGLDIYYIDETEKHPFSVVTSVRVPFLREVEGEWTFVWSDYLQRAVEWRCRITARHSVRFSKELHANVILAHQGQYKKPENNLRPDEATALMSDALASLDFLEPQSIMTAYADDRTVLMGERRINAAMLGLFQRIRRQLGDDRNGMIIFDDGKPEYIRLYRRATRWLPTGSALGGWKDGSSLNLSLDMFPKDANVKASKLSLFIQIADLVAYAARLKLEREHGLLPAKREKRGHGILYDSVFKDALNTRATGRRNDAIVPILSR